MHSFDSAQAAEYDKKSPTNLIGYDALYEIVMKVVASHPKRRVLVLGAGTGKETILMKQLFPEIEVIAVDPSEPMLEIARKKISAAGLQIDVRCGRLEHYDDLIELDAVLMIGVLHHLSGSAEQQSLLSRVGACLRSGGLLVSGCHVGPFDDPLRQKVREQQWRESGASENEIEKRRAKVSEIAAISPSDLSLWLEQADFSHSERIFSSLFFEVWGCLKASEISLR